MHQTAPPSTATTTSISAHRPHRLGLRIVATVLLCTLLFAVVVSSIQIYNAYQNALDETRLRAQDIERNYLPLLAAAMWSVDEPRITALVKGIAELPDVGEVLLEDDVGNRWAKRHSDFDTPLETLRLAISYEDNGETFLLGQLQVSLMNNRIISELRRTAQSIAITTLSSLLLSALFVLFIIHLWVSRHLEKMAAYAQQLDLNNLEAPLKLTRVAPHQPDELETLVEAINQMRLRIRDDLENRNRLMAELQLHRNKLEELVAERTQALEEKTIALEDKTKVLEQQSAELLEQNYELDAYAHTVAHDLKQPLTNMAASAAMLSAVSIGINLSDEKKRQLLLGLQRSAQKMQSIIDALLLLASLRKTDQINLQPLDIQAIAIEACNRLEPLIEKNRGQISIAHDWPKALGQAQWVEEIWVNYLSNALKYGGTAPQVQLGATRLNNGMVKCWVKDFGPGLSDLEQQQLFDLFVQFEHKSADGHGLGLSIVKRIARALNGDVGYEKTGDGGSLFWFSLQGVE
ncbi:sensor histidine kinase [Cellvibrio fontiphilus]|uniref:histidine kinase n=1 Tax=Cellvibrio fontiphilus TaxID=1815559 RepID=A0ABV7FI25_9GAMM